MHGAEEGTGGGLYLDVNFLFANVPVSQKNFHVQRGKFPKSNYMYGFWAVTVTQIANISPPRPRVRKHSDNVCCCCLKFWFINGADNRKP